MNATVLLEVRELTTELLTESGTLPVVSEVSLTVGRNQSIGVVGESGSGKTMLARSIMGLLPPGVRARHTGSILLNGVDLLQLPANELRSMWGSRLAVVLQDPLRALNPVLRVDRQIAEALPGGEFQGRNQKRARVLELLEEVGIPEANQRLRQYPHELSGGMRQRVCVAMALGGQPDLLIADEPTTALDVTVQAEILALLRREQQQRQMGMLLISHDLGVVAGHTDEVIVMYAGRVVERARSRDLISNPRMPYTKALLDVVPRLSDTGVRRTTISGRHPGPLDLPKGCAFHPRCPVAQDRCRVEMPPLTDGPDGRQHRCWYPVGLSSPSGRPSTQAA